MSSISFKISYIYGIYNVYDQTKQICILVLDHQFSGTLRIFRYNIPIIASSFYINSIALLGNRAPQIPRGTIFLICKFNIQSISFLSFTIQCKWTSSACSSTFQYSFLSNEHIIHIEIIIPTAKTLATYPCPGYKFELFKEFLES